MTDETSPHAIDQLAPAARRHECDRTTGREPAPAGARLAREARDYVMLGGEAYDSQTGEVIEFPGNRVRIKTAPPPKMERMQSHVGRHLDGARHVPTPITHAWRDLKSLHTITVGTKVKLDLGEDHPLGPHVIGWRAVTAQDRPVYYTYDKNARAHVEVKPLRWASLNPVGPGVA